MKLLNGDDTAHVEKLDLRINIKIKRPFIHTNRKDSSRILGTL